MIDNKIPGVASVAQRSGRPLKSVKERINGKGGRVRGNLMGKRVDFSARSVITPDANLSIKQLGVPMKVAKNITKPVKVTPGNRQFLLKLVQNGPDVHPGAKVLERINGDNISLRYIDRGSIRLEIGDIVHRHMMDGDAVLFNRQPTKSSKRACSSSVANAFPSTMLSPSQILAGNRSSLSCYLPICSSYRATYVTPSLLKER